jgi:hypothetical protein
VRRRDQKPPPGEDFSEERGFGEGDSISCWLLQEERGFRDGGFDYTIKCKKRVETRVPPPPTVASDMK